jgi:hypothetical protein
MVQEVHFKSFLKAAQGGVVRNALQSQRFQQLAVSSEPRLEFSEGPALMSHQAEERQKLGLGKDMFGTPASICGNHCLGDFPRQLSEREPFRFRHGNDLHGPQIIFRE